MEILEISAHSLNSLESRKISELPQITRLSSDDLFIISKIENDIINILQYPILNNEALYNRFLQHLVDKAVQQGIAESTVSQLLENIKRSTYKIKYEDLADKFFHDISADLHLSSMAYEDMYDYSRLGHRHNYSNVTVQTYYSDNVIGEISTVNSSGLVQVIEIGTPEISVKTPTYDVGEVKFIAVPNLQQKSITDPDFDGWVYADGKKYSKTKFPDAWEMFKTLDGSTDTQFVVPSLNNFIKPVTTSRDDRSQIELIPYKNHLPEHTHTIDNSQYSGFNKKMSITVKYPYYGADLVYQSETGSASIHTGYTSKISKMKINTNIKIDSSKIKSVSTKTKEMTYNEDESYPPYYNIPVMIYIGIPVA